LDSLCGGGKGFEGLLVVLFAGLQIPDVRDAQGEIKLPSMNMAVTVSRVGLASYLHPMTAEVPPKGQTPSSERSVPAKFQGAGATQAQRDQIFSQAFQVAASITSLNKVQTVLSSDQAHFNSIRNAKLLNKLFSMEEIQPTCLSIDRHGRH